MKDHLEAVNHAAALDRVRRIASRKGGVISEREILDIHGLILRGIDDANAGPYRNVAVRISGSTVTLPNPLKVPDLMEDLGTWLKKPEDHHPVALAAEAHYRLVTIHPFVDGNGRAARLLMNLILLMHGYPPAIIRKRDRLAYLRSLEKAQLGGSREPYLKLIAAAVNRSLDIYLKAVRGGEEGEEAAPEDERLLKIGQLAKAVGETVPTIRYWTSKGLLEVTDVTPSNYALYGLEMIGRVKRIQELKQERYTLAEIREILEKG